jgi:hypothetical protein
MGVAMLYEGIEQRRWRMNFGNGVRRDSPPNPSTVMTTRQYAPGASRRPSSCMACDLQEIVPVTYDGEGGRYTVLSCFVKSLSAVMLSSIVWRHDVRAGWWRSTVESSVNWPWE